jgi:eukaryotic-like serine/threonine-protein kinase
MSDANTLSCPRCEASITLADAEPLARVPCPKCGQRVRVARSFDHFELLETLGTGGMGTVYMAHDSQLERDVAIKVLRKDLGPEYVDQLQKEARITASINHANVVQVFSFGRAHDQYYLVMELVDRGTLEDLIEERGKLPEQEVLLAGIEVARGLRAAFQKGLIHRDVKPANILFASDGSAKVSDFGLAGLVEPHAQNPGAIWGTPYYVAPERLDNAPEDFRSDIYSLGATLFHAVAGCPPFEGETTSASDLRALKNRPLKLIQVAPEVSPATASVIGRMIAPDPRLRYHSYDSTIVALEKSRRLLLGEQEPARVKVVLLITALVMIAMAAAGWFFSRHARVVPASGRVTPSASPIDVNRVFEDARRKLTDGKFADARAAFARLGTETKPKQPIYDWAKLNEAVAALLDPSLPPERSQMKPALQEVENAGTSGFADHELGSFLLEIARRASAHSTIALSDVPQHAARPFALFFLGLVDVDLGRYTEAAALLGAFMHAPSAANFSWMSEYKPLAQKYLDDSRAWLAWREQRGSAKSAAEVKRALDNLKTLIPKLQKDTAIAREAVFEEKRLANQLSDAQWADKAQREQQHQELLARESPLWNGALEAFRRAATVYDFAAAGDAVRNVQLREPSLKATREAYERMANWLVEWKAQFISDLNTRGFNGRVVANNTEYTGIGGASATSLKLRNPYGFTEFDWLKIPPPTLLAASSAFATDADRKWRCGVFAWMIGQREAAKQLFDAACAAKPSYNEGRKFFDQARR